MTTADDSWLIARRQVDIIIIIIRHIEWSHLLFPRPTMASGTIWQDELKLILAKDLQF